MFGSASHIGALFSFAAKLGLSDGKSFYRSNPRVA